MSEQNYKLLIAELKQVVTVENDHAYKLLQELLSGIEVMERQLVEARGALAGQETLWHEEAVLRAING